MDAWGSGGLSEDVVGQLPRESFEEQQRKQQHHLASRECVQVFVNVLGARNIPEISRKKGFYLTLGGIQNCGSFKLTSPTVEKADDLDFPGEYRMLHFEAVSTAGFTLELTCTRTLFPDKSLGRISIRFNQGRAAPEQAWYPLSQEKNAPELLVKASVQGGVRSPYLLRGVTGEFQKDGFETLKVNKGGQKPEGRWSTRVVVDHYSHEKYLIRVRRAKVKKRYQNERNVLVEEWEREVCIYQRKFEQFNRKIYSLQAASVAGWAQQQIDTNSFKKDGHMQRQWSLFTDEDIQFQVRRDVTNVNWMEDLQLALTGKGFGHPVELRIGRHLQYGLANGKEDPGYQSGYVTVVRKTPDCPTGKGTALFNWKTIAMEVLPEENVMLVMLMATVTALVVQGWYEEETTDKKPKEKKKHKIRSSKADGTGLWGAVSMDTNNSMALSTLLRQFNQSLRYQVIHAKEFREVLNKQPQQDWPDAAFELLHDIFGGGCEMRKPGGYEGGYIQLDRSNMGGVGGADCGDGGGGGGGEGGGCGGGGDGGGGGGGGGGVKEGEEEGVKEGEEEGVKEEEEEEEEKEVVVVVVDGKAFKL